MVVTVCLKAGLITNSWTWLTHCSIWGSIALWFVFMLVYRLVSIDDKIQFSGNLPKKLLFSHFWSIFKFGAVFAGMGTMIYTSPVFWLGLLLTPVAALLLDVVIKV